MLVIVRKFSLFIIGVLLLSSCSISKMASDITAGIMVGGAPIVEQESDPAVAEEAGLALLKTLEVFSYHNPSNEKYKTLLAKNYATYAFGFLENKLYKYEDVNPERYQSTLARAKLFYTRGKNYGMDVLKKRGSFARALSEDQEKFAKAVRGFGGGKMPALFWTAFAWGGLINWSKDDPTAIVSLGKVELMMARAAALNNTFYYGGPHLFYGVYYGSRPEMLGGNKAKSQEHFEKALKITHGRFFFTKVLYAQFYAVQAQDRGLFDRLLQEVISGDPNVLPEQRLGNILAQERAQTLLAKGNSLFAGQ